MATGSQNNDIGGNIIKSRLLGALCACIVVFTSAVISISAHATLIERTINVGASDFRIWESTDAAGNQGKQFEVLADVTPFFLSAGDAIKTNVLFNTPLVLTDLNDRFWSSFTGNVSGVEPVGSIYWFTDGSSGTGSNASASVSYSISFDVASGVPAINPLTGNINSGGGGVSVGTKTTGSNITNSLLAINGLTILSDISSYTLNRGDGEISLFQFHTQAGDISLSSVPAPSILYLLAPGLIGLVGVARWKAGYK